MSWKKIVVIVLVIAVLVVVLIANLGPKEKVKIGVRLEPTRLEPITQVVTASGKIRPETQVRVSADVGGYIRELTVKEGQTVKPGELLVQVDPQAYKARLLETQAAESTAQARLKVAEASLGKVRGEFKRVQGLFAKELTSAAALESAQSQLGMAEAEVDASTGALLQAQASLSRARTDLAKCTITSPMNGTIVDLLKKLGERVSGGDFREDIIMTIADLSSMEVEVEVGERDVVLIKEKDPVDIEVDAYPGKTVSGWVKQIGRSGVTRNPFTESEVTNFKVVVQVGQTEYLLRPQMSATVRIRTDHKEQALTVPIQSVTLRLPSEIRDEAEKPDQPGRKAAPPPSAGPGEEGKPKTETPVEVVFVVEDGKARAKQVKTGLASDSRIEVLEGVAEGTKVVAGPYRALSKDLKHGADVREDGLGEGGRFGGRRDREEH